MTNVTIIRNLLKAAGMQQITRSNSRAIGCGRAFGDYSVKEELITTKTRFGVGYKIKTRSTKTGNIEIECNCGSLEKIGEIIKDIPHTNKSSSFIIPESYFTF